MELLGVFDDINKRDSEVNKYRLLVYDETDGKSVYRIVEKNELEEELGTTIRTTAIGLNHFVSYKHMAIAGLMLQMYKRLKEGFPALAFDYICNICNNVESDGTITCSVYSKPVMTLREAKWFEHSERDMSISDNVKLIFGITLSFTDTKVEYEISLLEKKGLEVYTTYTGKKIAFAGTIDEKADFDSAKFIAANAVHSFLMLMKNQLNCELDRPVVMLSLEKSGEYLYTGVPELLKVDSQTLFRLITLGLKVKCDQGVASPILANAYRIPDMFRARNNVCIKRDGTATIYDDCCSVSIDKKAMIKLIRANGFGDSITELRQQQKNYDEQEEVMASAESIREVLDRRQLKALDF